MEIYGRALVPVAKKSTTTANAAEQYEVAETAPVEEPEAEE